MAWQRLKHVHVLEWSSQSLHFTQTENFWRDLEFSKSQKNEGRFRSLDGQRWLRIQQPQEYDVCLLSVGTRMRGVTEMRAFKGSETRPPVRRAHDRHTLTQIKQTDQTFPLVEHKDLSAEEAF